MNLEPYAPAASLLLLGMLGLISFLRARVLMRRMVTPVVAHEQSPWWESHLQDYVERPAPVLNAPFEADVAMREPAVEQSPTAETTPEPQQEAPRPVEAEPEQGVREQVLATPVELWFGDQRVAVREGSDTERRFQRFADVLFEDLRSGGSVQP